ncbi:MAG: 50S ribosomal protein L9 [Spirochaetaceae bacterium]|jgi:large subunit ribosomal protein L9|nr:50S ribosomal protein L9 [Spirochaetaceae bacterium]
MKVILNKDLASLGEEGDVKEVARGFARNFLFPRNIALRYNDETAAMFEARKEEIEKRKEQKRHDAGAVKERLEALEILVSVPAGPNGKLYGAVTTLTVSEELEKQGFQIERKKIELPGGGIKSAGKYKALVKLYGAAQAEVNVTVTAAETKTEETPKDKRRRWKNEREENPQETKPTEEAAESGSEVSGEKELVEEETREPSA